MSVGDQTAPPPENGGEAPRRNARPDHLFAICGVLLLIASIPVWLTFETIRDRRQLVTDWTFDGPPCPTSTSGATLTFRKPPQSFVYEGVKFSRQFGNVSCQTFHEGSIFSRGLYEVCQFSAPAVIEVSVGGRVVHYAPGVGRPAVVTVRDGAPVCVLAGWFRW